MRILHAIRSDGWAGVERHVAELAGVQQRLGDDVIVVGGDPARMRAALDPRVRHRPARSLQQVVAAIAKLASGADIINTHMTAADVAATLAARSRPARIVSTRHFAAPRGSSPLVKSALRGLIAGVDAQIAVSRFVADRVDGSSTVVLSGVRPDPGRRIPAHERIPLVLVAQRLEREKCTDVALKAFAEAGLAGRHWRLAVAGDGTLRAELEALAVRLGIRDQVDFLGLRDDVGTLMTRAAVFMAPRPDEAFGLSVVEAMARGLPVVAAGSGAHLETVGLLDGAALYRPDDEEQAARVLLALVASPSDLDDYGARLQELQRSRLTIEQQALRTRDVYRSLL
jgi:glycosyltransferase involved in cell wall biosynthesis